jgi:hypothetical protein
MANVKISELPVATSVSNADALLLVQGGATKQITKQTLFGGSDMGLGGGSQSTNVFVGDGGLQNNTTGDNNVAIGFLPLFNNTSGDFNVAVGSRSLENNGLGARNIAVGYYALQANSAGVDCVAIGDQSLKLNTSNNNIGVGAEAGIDVTTGSSNTIIGTRSKAGSATATNRVVLGREVTGTANNRFTVGSGTNIAELDLNGSDTSWSASSDERLKTNIAPSQAGLDVLLALQTVTFQWKRQRDVDPSVPGHSNSEDPVHGEYGDVCLGFVAQQAQQATQQYPFLSLVRKRENGILTTAPAALIPVLVKAIQEQQAVIDDLCARVAALEA